MALSGRVSLNANFTHTKSQDLALAAHTPAISHVLDIANGTGANQADLIWSDERTVASASNDDLDLAGVLADVYGATLTFAEIVGIIIIAGSANTTELTIGGATNPFVGPFGAGTQTIGKLGANGVFFIMNPSATGIGTVTASTADIFRVANGSGASATYKILVLGRSA